jgi:hypothetical protein
MALNKLKYDQLETGSVYPITASYAISSSVGNGGTTLVTGSTYPITSSWSNNSVSSISSSYSNNSISASFATNTSLFNNTASSVFATTGSNNFDGNQIVQGNVTVIGNLTAQQYVVSSSISYFTSSYFDGSTKFGDTESDTHQFTGSLRAPNITGSLLGTSSFSNNSTSASYATVADTATSATSTTSASYALSSSYSVNSNTSISSSYALTASYISNSIINWTGSNYVSDTVTQSVAAFNSFGNPTLVTPTSDNVYLVVQNGIMKWIPIASAVISFLNSDFSEDETINDGLYETTIIPISFNASTFTSGSI